MDKKAERLVNNCNMLGNLFVNMGLTSADVIEIMFTMLASLFAEKNVPSHDAKKIFEEVLIQYHNAWMERNGRK